MIIKYSNLWSDEKYEKEAMIGLYILLMGLLLLICVWTVVLLAIALTITGLYLFFCKGIVRLNRPYPHSNGLTKVIATFSGIILVFIGLTLLFNNFLF